MSEYRNALIQDCPVFDLEPLGMPCHKVSIERNRAILIGSGAVVRAKVHIPDPYGIYYVLARSRFARAGLDIRMLHDELKRRFVYTGIPVLKVSVLIRNLGKHAVLLREDDIAVAVADYQKITRQRSVTPHTAVCPDAMSNGSHLFLSIGNQRLQIVEHRLPLFPLSPARRVRYIDPLAGDLSSFTEAVEFEEFGVAPGDSFVVNSQEYLRMPRGEVGLLYCVTDDFAHSSALIIYPGSEGYQAFEFTANRPTIVRRGMKEVMILGLYQCPTANGSGGRYAHQDSLII